MATPLRLSEAPQQTPLEVLALPDDPLGRRLAALGLEPGVRATITRHALFGGPLLLAWSGARLALRRTEAEGVLVQIAGPA
jgi:Fe2+ transport system protein FeoA